MYHRMGFFVLLQALFMVLAACGSNRPASVPTSTLAPTFTATSNLTVVLVPTDTPTPQSISRPSDTESLGPSAQVINVVDGDTIDVLINGQKDTVRYIGIDTPERGDPGYQAATEANRQLLGNDTIYLVPDQTNRDRYDRLLRYVYTSADVFVDREMVAQGWAQPVEYPPDTRHAAEFRQAAIEAAQNNLGFWSGTSSYDGAMSYGITTSAANVRKGPGIDFASNGVAEANTPVTIFGRNQAADWFQVRLPNRSGGWIYTDLIRINVSIEQIPITVHEPTPTPTATEAPVVTGPTPTATSITTNGLPGKVEISYIFFDGEEPQVEGDEYVAIKNIGGLPVNLVGWRLNADDEGQDFIFPSIDLAPGQECRVYTNRNDPNTCSLSFRSGQALWANGGECGRLFDTTGTQVSEYCY